MSLLQRNAHLIRETRPGYSEHAHADTLERTLNQDAVVGFGFEMFNKLDKAYKEKGKGRWYDWQTCEIKDLELLLEKHLQKDNPDNYVDIANICMMLHYRTEQDGKV